MQEPTANMPAEISLACWILGLDNANLFLIDILRSKTVDHLKKAIKKEKENAFNHIDADQLEIWKVSDPAWHAAYPPLLMRSDATRLQLLKPLRSRDLARTLGKIGAGDEVPNADKLDPIEDLSHYFSEPPVKGMIHLVVRLPPGE
jgi:hypothetical protein